MTDGLVAFLRARLDEVEQAARGAGGKAWKWEHGYGDMCNDSTCPYGELATDDTVLMQVHGYDIRSPWQGGPHIEHHHPARVLRQVEAQRGIITAHGWFRDHAHVLDGPVVGICQCGEDQPCPTLRYLALPYDDHPDYRPEWRP